MIYLESEVRMSSFYCEKCGTAIIDSPNGYITGCEHYPTALQAENKRLREALEKIAVIDSYKDCEQIPYICCSKCKNGDKCIYYLAETTLRGYKCD